jgi:hypothetical protein
MSASHRNRGCGCGRIGAAGDIQLRRDQLVRQADETVPATDSSKSRSA